MWPVSEVLNCFCEMNHISGTGYKTYVITLSMLGGDNILALGGQRQVWSGTCSETLSGQPTRVLFC